jgi:phosphatidylglycerophosphatase A
VNKILVKLFATGLGTGYLPVASGTAGSLLALVVYRAFFYGNTHHFAVVTLLTLAVSFYLCGAAEKLFGTKDDSRVVLDEVVGMWISLLFLPGSLVIMVLAFFIFRFFDVVKPFFRPVQKLPGGYGIVIDDVIAAVLTNLVIRLILFIKLI